MCPTGKNSWCKFNSVAAYNRLPANHKDIVKLPLNEELLGPHILPIYERLTADNLLSRCLRKKTQNANDSFHSVVWAKCPKSNHQSNSRIEHAALTAAMEFNFGPLCFGEIKSFFGMPDSKAGAKMRTARSNKRLHDSKRKANIETKKKED